MGDNFYSVDGVNADIVSVSRVIDGFDCVPHVISGLRYACDLGDGESYTRQGYVDCMTGEISFNAEVVDFNKGGI